MPEIVNCPQCERKLRVPEDLLGKLVKCPTCGNTFTAEVGAPPARVPSPPARYEEEAPARSSPPLADEEPAGRRRSRRWEDEDEEDYGSRSRRRRRLRRDFTPHRGVLILVLGILSIVVCGWVGPVALFLAHQDLQEIQAGRMDPEGEGTTRAGQICGIIGTVFGAFQLCCVGFWILGMMSAAMDVH